MTEERAIQEWKQLLDTKQPIVQYRNALAGDGGGTVNVTGEPGYIWCRYQGDQSKTSKVFNIIAPGIPEDFPIVVGKRFPSDEYEQVLAVNWVLYQDLVTQDTVDNYSTGSHGESHNAASGADPAPIDLRNIVELRGRSQATPDLTVHVEQGQYIYGYNTIHRFPGGNIDLTAEVPAFGHCYVLVFVDGLSNLLDSDTGLAVPPAVTPPIPDLTANTIPVCVVELSVGQTTITEDDIYDWRFLWDLVSWSGAVIVGTNGDRTAYAIEDLGEMTRWYTTDTDQIWEVWEGAWRIVYPPSYLAASDGSPGTPWTVSATGVLTGNYDLVLDDNSGISPIMWFTDGDNTSAKLAYDSTNNRFQIQFSAAAKNVVFMNSANNRLAMFGTAESIINEDAIDMDFRVEGTTNTDLLKVDAGNDQVGINGILTSRPDEITATHAGVAASIDTVNTEVTTNGDADLDNVTLANGISGQIKNIYCVVLGNPGDTWKITPASMVGGSQITFAGAGEGCMLVYADNEGWVVVGNNGGTIT